MINISSLLLPDDRRFTGGDLDAFLLKFGLLLAGIGIEYLVNDKGMGTREGAIATNLAGREAGRAPDSRALYKLLLADVVQDVQTIVWEKDVLWEETREIRCRRLPPLHGPHMGRRRHLLV